MNILGEFGCSWGRDEERGLHILCECPKFSQLRHRTLELYVMQPSELIKLGLAELDRFLKLGPAKIDRFLKLGPAQLYRFLVWTRRFERI